MTTQIDGTTGVSRHQAGSVEQGDLAANVVGKGPVFQASRTGAAITSGASTKQTGLVVSTDSHGYWDAGISRYTPLVAGWYSINMVETYTAGTALVYGAAQIAKSGDRSSVMAAPYGSLYSRPGISRVFYMNGTTDYFEIFAEASGTGGITVAIDSVDIVLVRAA